MSNDKKCRDCERIDSYYRCPSCEIKRVAKFSAKEIKIDKELGVKLLSIVAAYMDLHIKIRPNLESFFTNEYVPVIQKLEKLLYNDND